MGSQEHWWDEGRHECWYEQELCLPHPSHLSKLETVLTHSETSHVWVPGWLKGPVCAATAYSSLVLTVWL